MTFLELIATVLFYAVGITGWALFIWFVFFEGIRLRRGDFDADHPDRERVGIDLEDFGPPEVSGPTQLDTAGPEAKVGASREQV